MSTHGRPHRTTPDGEDKLAILETVRRHNSIQFSTLVELLSLDDADTDAALSELRTDGLVSTCPLHGEDDSVVTSLPRLREHERTKIHRLIYN